MSSKRIKKIIYLNGDSLVGIYVRVSTDEQANNGFSIRAQIDKLSGYCKLKDWSIFDIYSDEGKSGKNINERSELIRLINDIKLRKINSILVYKIDRLTRSTKDLIELVELFNKYNCSFNSFTESIDTSSSTGRMFIKIIGIFAEFERENIAERVRMGLERKVKEGYSIASRNVSYGYDKSPTKGLLVVNQYEAYVVKRIFNLYLNNYSFTDISKYLNKYNVKTKNKEKWNSKTVRLILTNSTYIGKVRYGINKKYYFENPGRHEAIVSKEIFDRAIRKLNSSSLNHNVYCCCGKKLTVKKTIYYSSKKRKKVKYCKFYCSKCNNSFSFNLFDKKMNSIIDNWKMLDYKEKRQYLANNKIIISGIDIVINTF